MLFGVLVFGTGEDMAFPHFLRLDFVGVEEGLVDVDGVLVDVEGGLVAVEGAF